MHCNIAHSRGNWVNQLVVIFESCCKIWTKICDVMIVTLKQVGHYVWFWFRGQDLSRLIWFGKNMNNKSDTSLPFLPPFLEVARMFCFVGLFLLFDLSGLVVLFVYFTFFLKLAGKVAVLSTWSDDSSPAAAPFFSPFFTFEFFAPIPLLPARQSLPPAARFGPRNHNEPRDHSLSQSRRSVDGPRPSAAVAARV